MGSPAEAVVKSENCEGRLVCGMWGEAREHGFCLETMRGSSWPHTAHRSPGSISLTVPEMSGKPASVSLLSCWTPAVPPVRRGRDADFPTEVLCSYFSHLHKPDIQKFLVRN